MKRKESINKVFKRFEKEYLKFEEMNKIKENEISIEDIESKIVIWIMNFIEMNNLYENEKERKRR